MSSACPDVPQPPLVASNIEVTKPLPGVRMSAGYLTLGNNSPESIRISSVSSEQFELVEIHESVVDNGIAKMRRLSGLVIPPKSALTLERGGKHLMLMRPLATSGSVSLNFYSGDTLMLSVNATVSQGSD